MHTNAFKFCDKQDILIYEKVIYGLYGLLNYEPFALRVGFCNITIPVTMQLQ